MRGHAIKVRASEGEASGHKGGERMSGEQMTELGQSATQIHELYSALREVGFASEQACYFVAALTVQNPGTAPPGVTSDKLDRVADSVWRDDR